MNDYEREQKALEMALTCKNPTRKQIEDGLQDPNNQIRDAWLRREDILIDEDMIKKFFREEDNANSNWVGRSDFHPDHDTICRNLRSDNDLVRFIWSRTHPDVGSEVLSDLLLDIDYDVRANTAGNPHLSPTREQIMMGVLDKHPKVRAAWACREDISLSTRQIEDLMSDEVCNVRKSIARNRQFHPTENMVMMGITDSDEDVRLIWVQRTDYEVTRRMLDVGLKDHNKVIEQEWMGRWRNEVESTIAENEDDNVSAPSI